MKNIVVTGGSGKAGRVVVRELLEHGYNVINVDLQPPPEPLCTSSGRPQRTGQAIDAMGRAADGERDASLRVGRRRGAPRWHPCAGSRAGRDHLSEQPDETYNVFSAATLLGLERVVWASSETLFGLPFTRECPAFAPITEQHPMLPENGYALAKGLAEEMAQMHRWNPGTSFLGLRISNIIDPLEYGMFAQWQADPGIRKWNLWSYVDSRDVAQACRLGLEASITGAQHCIIAAADTVMARPSRELMAECFPQVKLTPRSASSNRSSRVRWQIACAATCHATPGAKEHDEHEQRLQPGGPFAARQRTPAPSGTINCW